MDFFAARGRRAAVGETEFSANCEALIAFYRSQGMARAEKRVLACEPLTASLSLLRTADRIPDAAGGEIAAWEHLCVLSRTDAHLRAAAAFPQGELDAWEKRGTPLGSW